MLIAFCWSTTWAQQDYLRIMEWNVENLFDCRHDSLKDDFEFMPEADRKWDEGRFWRKIRDVGRVIMAVGNDSPPALVGLCEVENDSVMEKLTRHGTLWSLGYQYVMTNSPDERGIDVALMYQPEMFDLQGNESFGIPSTGNGYKPTRDILHAWGTVPWGDTLHVIVCHLPSRQGDSRKADRHRALAAQTLKQVCDSILLLGDNTKMVVMGDFNAGYRDPVFRRWIRPFSIKEDSKENGLCLLTPQQKFPHIGTYYYQGNWEWIDHILVSSSLLGKGEPAHIYTAEWMQEEDSHGGWHPRRTFQGPVYKGGVSDHVPIYWDLREEF